MPKHKAAGDARVTSFIATKQQNQENETLS
jgi:hypothetical protein